MNTTWSTFWVRLAIITLLLLTVFVMSLSSDQSVEEFLNP